MVDSIARASGHNLYFHSEYDVESGRPTMEVDFLVAKSNLHRLHNVVPIEVKATHGRSRSLDELLRSKDLSCGCKFTGGNVGRLGKKITLPHYMAMFLRPVR